MAFSTQADLEVALGAQRLLELADPDDTGDIADASVVARIDGWIEDAAADVRALVEIKHDPEALAAIDAPSLRRLKRAETDLAARRACEDGGEGFVMPPHVELRAKRAEEYLDDLATGRQRLGRVAGGTVAAVSQPAGVIDHDALGTKVSMAGLARGFR